MPKIVLMIDGAADRELPLTKSRTTFGRRPYNDVVIDNLAVSGEHAVMNMADGEVTVEDLGSTNGTYVNGKGVKKQVLVDGDTLEMGKVRIRFEGDAPVAQKKAVIKVLSGPAAGREMALTKEVSTVGKPGVAVAAITRRLRAYQLHLAEGSDTLTLNGAAVTSEPMPLQHGDEIVLAGTRMQFLLS